MESYCSLCTLDTIHRMIFFTKNKLIDWNGVKVELVIIGVIITPLLPFIPVWHVNWTSLLCIGECIP
jgi:hypothetical protein